MQHPVVFVDKDGTLIKDVPYNIDPARIALEEGVAPGLRRLAEAGFSFVVVSNQSGVARGYFPEVALDRVAAYLDTLLDQAAGIQLEGFYYCPHYPEGTVSKYSLECACRKPRPGMLLAAAAELDIQLDQSWMVGDILNDVEAGNRAGCRTILIDNGHETEWQTGPFRTPDFTATNFAEAAEIILAETRQAGKVHQHETGGRTAKRGDQYAEHLDE